MPDGNIAFYDRFADFYDVANPRAAVEFAFHKAFAKGADSLLEVACGTGTLTPTFTEVVRHYEGLDAAEGMLALARKRFPSALFHLADMRSFDLGRRFDLVVCPFNSFLHLTDMDDAATALCQFARHCAPGGKIVIDVCNVVPDYAPLQVRDAILNEFSDPDTGIAMIVREDSDFDRATLTFDIRWRVTEAHSGRIVAREAFTMRQYLPGDMMDLCATAELQVIAQYGCHAFSPFGQLSPRHIIVARPLSNTGEPF